MLLHCSILVSHEGATYVSMHMVQLCSKVYQSILVFYSILTCAGKHAAGVFFSLNNLANEQGNNNSQIPMAAWATPMQ